MNEKAVILGEKSAIISFVSQLLNDEVRDLYKTLCHRFDSQNTEEKNLVSCINAVHSKEISVFSENSTIVINTPYVPEGYEIYCQEYNPINLKLEIKKMNADCMFLLFSFRFEKMLRIFSNLKNDLISENLKPVRIKAVVYDDPEIHTASTDISNPEVEYQNALDMIKKMIKDDNLSGIIEVSEFRKPEDLFSVFSGGDRTLCYYSEILDSVAEILKGNINCFLDNYVFILRDVIDLWVPERYSAITEYKAVSRSRNLFGSFISGYFDSEAWNELVSRLKTEYLSLFRDFSFWNLEKDWENVMNTLRHKAEKYLSERNHPVIIIDNKYTDYSYSVLLSSERFDMFFAEEAETMMREEIPLYFIDELKLRASVFE